MTNTRLQKIESIWNELRSKPFPESGYEAFADERDFVELDTFASGCISTFISSAGKLDQKRYDVLKSCSEDLSIGIKGLEPGPFKSYAEQLHLLSNLVLEYLDGKLRECAEVSSVQNRDAGADS